MLEIIRRFNEIENRIDLNKSFLMNYIKSDGFNERLLIADLRIDYNFKFMLILNAFDHIKITKNQSDTIIIEGELTERLITQIEKLLFGDLSSLKAKYDYENFIITDVETKLILLNIEDNTKNIHIDGNLPKEYFKNDTELDLYLLNQNLKGWIESLYNAWLK